jgi:hypothetical protein
MTCNPVKDELLAISNTENTGSFYTIQGKHITDDRLLYVVTALSNNEHVKTLQIDGCNITPVCLHMLNVLPSIKSIVFKNMSFGDHIAEYLTKSHVTTVTMENTRLTRKGYIHLFSNKKLNQLTLNKEDKIDASVACVMSNGTLKKLSFEFCGISPTAVRLLSMAGSFDSLSFVHCTNIPDNLKLESVNTKTLTVINCNIINLENLAMNKHVEEAYFQDNPIFDPSCLIRNDTLKSIDLSGCPLHPAFKQALTLSFDEDPELPNVFTRKVAKGTQ